MPSKHIEEFLNHVWTEQHNLYFPVLHALKGKKGMHQELVQRISVGAHKLQQWDDMQLETYFGISIYKTGLNRTHENVAFTGLLPVDIDIAPKSKYADAYTAALDLINLARDIGLPRPTPVGSGGGIHGYWFLDTFLKPEQWQPIADGVKQALQEAGLDIDPARSADRSSILRVPGTHNWKTGVPREVLWDGKVNYHPVSAFDAFARRVPWKPKRTYHIGVSHPATLLAAAMVNETPLPDHVAEYCGQLGAFRLSGNVSEPMWHALAGTMVFMLGGQKKFHEWSQRDFPDYNENETQAKLEQIKNTGPTTCNHFHSVNRDTCEACPFWGKITTPLQAPTNREIEPPKEVNGVALEAGPMAQVAQSELSFDNLPPMEGIGLKWNNKKSLVINVEDNSKKALHAITVSEKPFYISRVTRMENTAGGLAMNSEITFLRSTGEESKLIIPNTKLYSPSGHQILTGDGLLINDWTLGKKALMHMGNNMKTEGTQYVRMGWKDGGSFLLGNKLIKGDRVEVVAVGPQIMSRARLIRPRATGSLTEWRKEASKLAQKGLEPMCFIVGAAFASPLRALWNEEEGAILCHGVAKTAKGKTLALEMSASIWGEYNALRLTSDDTRNSKVVLLGTFTHLPAYQDELLAQDPVLLANWVRTLTEGRDKSRLLPDGTLNESDHHWGNNIISTSNQSCRDHLHGHGDTAEAMMMRLIEIGFDTAQIYSMVEFETIKNNMQANAGHAGFEFISYITQKGMPEILLEKMRAARKWLIEEYKFEPKHRYYLKFLAEFLVGGEIAVKIGAIEFDPLRMTRWAAEQIKQDIDKPVAEPTIYDEPAAKVLVEFLNTHNQSKLIVKTNKEGIMQGVPLLEPKDGVVRIRHELAEKVMYLHDKTFTSWLVENGYGIRGVLEELIKLGIMDNFKKKKDLGAGTTYAFGGQADCYVVRVSKFQPLTEEESKVIKLERIKKK